jgi:5-methylcytosine-specific restriction endonuclease McrA
MIIDREKERQRILKHIAERRILAIKFLGGKCANCGSLDELEFDHIDPKTKKFSIASKLAMKYENLLIELAKCQLLCSACHRIKTSVEKSVEHGGGLTGKHHCKCHLCYEKKLAYMREYNYNKAK